MGTNRPVFVALGSNIAPREKYLSQAFHWIENRSEINAVSEIRDTEPIGVPTEKRFLNRVLEVTPDETFDPEGYLAFLLEGEAKIGRDRARAPDRVIDLDLLYWGQLEQDEDPILPHPRLHRRGFVLKPMVELAPEFEHPRLNKTQEELLQEWKRQSLEDER